MEAGWSTDLTRLRDLLQTHERLEEQIILHDPECCPGFVPDGKDPVNFVHRPRDRFLKVHVISSLESGTGDITVQRGRDEDLNQVHLGLQEVLDVNEPFGVRPVACPLVDSAWFNVAQSHNFSVRVALVTGHTEVVDLTQPEDPDPDPTLDRDLGRSSGHPCNLQAIGRASRE